MVFLLNNQNVFQYLIEQKIIKHEERESVQIEPKICKNFNLLIHALDNNYFLIKQEPHDQNGNTHRDFLHEWQVYQLLRSHAELTSIQPLLPEAIHFDTKHSILIFNYLVNYCDLEDFYVQTRTYPTSIAAALGATLAAIHRTTFDRQDYKAFLAEEDEDEDKDENLDDAATELVPDLSHDLEVITPEIFGMVSADGLKFYELYQRYESLSQAIRELNTAYEPCCLIHNDLKLSNVLLHLEWETLPFPSASIDRFCLDSLSSSKTGKDYPIRLIDWEKWIWGDPAADLGTLVASYLKIWLKSLTVRSGITLDIALRLAHTPLEAIQPSIVALTQAYLAHFTEILEQSPDFLRRTMQFAGLSLIESILAKLHYHEPFGNIEICMLQVAKTLLCDPLQSIPTVFGISPSELLHLDQPLKLSQQPLSEIPQQTISQPAIPQHPSTTQTESKIPSRLNLTPDAMLQDLVNNVQIQANFCIQHLHYTSPVQPEEGLADRLYQLPAELQHSYLRAQLQNYLYDMYFSGEYFSNEQGFAQTAEIAEIAETDNGSFDSAIVENNMIRGLNAPFYEQLHLSNCGAGYFDPGWRIVRQEQNETFAVQKDGLTVHIQPQQHLRAIEHLPSIGDIVDIRLPRHRFEAGFYVAVGNAGLVPDDAPTIELYFNVTPTGAIVLMQRLTQHLNAIGIPFLFKAIADSAEYERCDSGILQVERSRYQQIQPVLQSIYAEIAPNQIHPTVPLLTKMLAPGIGLAEEPASELDSTDFGLNRCQLIANAILSIWGTKNDSPQARLNAIRQHFVQQKIDWQRPYLNPNSEDIYTLLIVP